MSDFLSEVVQVPEVEDRLRSTDNGPTTVFAISDEAFSNLDDIARSLLFSDIARELTISAHIGEGQFVEKKLYRGRLINTLASNVTLHIGRTGNRTVEVFHLNISYENPVGFIYRIGMDVQHTAGITGCFQAVIARL